MEETDSDYDSEYDQREPDDLGEDEYEESKESELDHFPIEALDKILPLQVTPETVRDPKKLLKFLETVKINIDAHTKAFKDLSTIMKTEVRTRPTFNDLLEQLKLKS